MPSKTESFFPGIIYFFLSAILSTSLKYRGWHYPFSTRKLVVFFPIQIVVFKKFFFLLSHSSIVFFLNLLSNHLRLRSQRGKFSYSMVEKTQGVAVVDFYVANEILDQLVEFLATKYDSLVRAAGVKNISYWVSETSPNNYPGHPIFPDKNLLGSISFYKDEQE